MADRIRFVFVGKDDKFSFGTQEEEKFFKEHGEYADAVSFHRIPNNTENLTVVFNRLLSEERKNRDNDYLILMHADVSLDFDHLIRHIAESGEKYDIIGLCGCQKMNVSQSPLNWFTGSIPIPQFRWGCVTHGELSDRKSFFSQDRKEITDSPVACIDGLCIIFGRKALETSICFDENLRFNCYDTQISFDAILNYNLRLGVLVEESLKHFSVGKSILTKEFLNEEIVLRRRFNLEIPPNSPINRLLKKTEDEVRLI